jgi:Tfp pilus assembly protein PilF
MRKFTVCVAVAAGLMTATSVMADERITLFEDGASAEELAKNQLANGDWASAEAALIGTEFSQEDQVFAKLNLAFVYSATGRKDQAVALYNEVLAAKENPYALTNAGHSRRVKTIAKAALKRLGEG